MTTPSKKHLKFAVLATDVLLFTVHENELLVRLMTVNRPPFFVNQPGLPGGLLQPTETARDAALRLLADKGRVEPTKIFGEQLYTFSEVNRDPRGRVVSVAYIGCVAWDALTEKERASTADAYWQPIRTVKKLAYDHNDMLKVGLERLRSKIKYTTLLATLLPKEFTLTELQQAYELILGEKIDKRNFRKKLNQLDFLKPAGKVRSGLKSRPAALYSFKSKKVVEMGMMAS